MSERHFLVIYCPHTILLSFYLQIAIYGKSFNESARDAWELFQSTGIETLVAYDCSGAVLLMGTIMGGLISGSSAGVWAWYRAHDRVMMVGFTSMLMGMIMVCSQTISFISLCVLQPLLFAEPTHRRDDGQWSFCYSFTIANFVMIVIRTNGSIHLEQMGASLLYGAWSFKQVMSKYNRIHFDALCL